MREQAVARVGGGDVELERGAAYLVRDLGESVARSGDVDAHDGRAVAGEDLGDGRTDAAGGARDDRDLAVERLLPGGLGRREDPASDDTVTSCPSTNALFDERKNRSSPATDGPSSVASPLSTIPFPVAPARSSFATDRSTPSIPTRTAESAGPSSGVAARETVTMRPLGATRRSVEPSASIGPDRPVGSSTSVSTTTTPAQRPPSSSWLGWRRTSRPQPVSRRATASASGEVGAASGAGAGCRRGPGRAPGR
ncbi:hypothetical protein GCM10025864_21540 [Luteimicrobium album]|uniref:Uncharacterized protein n=1 Tax=Luteimicrobium album TaxID=1054550 RepID=A0ABQ6I165_9MICO|nr:hypothetical protein GCM10025864_21540 [Luteimicrobium album]